MYNERKRFFVSPWKRETKCNKCCQVRIIESCWQTVSFHAKFFVAGNLVSDFCFLFGIFFFSMFLFMNFLLVSIVLFSVTLCPPVFCIYYQLNIDENRFFSPLLAHTSIAFHTDSFLGHSWAIDLLFSVHPKNHWIAIVFLFLCRSSLHVPVMLVGVKNDEFCARKDPWGITAMKFFERNL